MIIKREFVISNNLKNFIQKDKCEKHILHLMNASKIVFTGEYQQNKEQSCNECDFYDVATFEKFNVKFPFDEKEGMFINGKNANFEEWVNFMLDEETEFTKKTIINRGKYNEDDLQLYRTMKKRLQTVEDDENAVFIFPYPIINDREGIWIFQKTSDILSYIFSKLNSNGLVGERKIYAIYPSINENIVLRCLNDNLREYLFCQELNEIFSCRIHT